MSRGNVLRQERKKQIRNARGRTEYGIIIPGPSEGSFVNETGDVADGLGLPRFADALREREERFCAFARTSFDVVYRMSPDWTGMRHLWWPLDATHAP